MPTRNVNLTEELDRFILAKIESGITKMLARSCATP